MAEFSDLSQPFLIDARSIRGRLVRLGPALDRILSGHDYPEAVGLRMAEATALAATLAGALKFTGIFTLQVQSEGAISLLVADVTSDGDLRGYARFDEAKLAEAEADESLAGAPVPRYLGKGFLAFTVDQGADTERYQGIVELTGDTLADCAQAYFEQSEQLETAYLLAARPPRDGHGWKAASLMIQRMPLGPTSPILTAEEAEENWNRATILLASAKEQELFDADLAAPALLHRLYHAEQLELHDPRPLQARCRCSAERVETTLKSFPRSEMEELKDENGHIVVTCEYCKSSYSFAEGDLDRLYAENNHGS
ncbi:MAG TPA: Hsp33 family molecular chaperone HslO [Magnetospirillaceae bacterium]|nr:Hsp33 family molecular chaperone HslO [Magnetospirillaceae bacterium]